MVSPIKPPVKFESLLCIYNINSQCTWDVNKQKKNFMRAGIRTSRLGKVDAVTCNDSIAFHSSVLYNYKRCTNFENQHV